MATYTHSITLADTGGSYSLLGTREAEAGDVIVLIVSYSSGGSNDSITETGGWPAAVAPPNKPTSLGFSTFSWTVPELDNNGVSTSGRNFHLHFFASTGIPYWNYVTDYRGKFKVTVPAGNVCTTGPTGSITSITIPTTEAATVACTINGPSAGTNCTIQSRALTEAQYDAQHDGQWFPGLVRNATRGTSYVFQVRNQQVPGTILSSSVTAIPYLATDMDVGVANNTVTADATTGYWQQTVTNISGNYNNYRTYVGNTPLMRGSTPPQSNQYLNTGVGNSLIDNQHIGNAPAVGESLTVTLWGGRTAASGGSGIPGFTATTTSFTVVRGVGHSESISTTNSNNNGSYFDNDTATGASHSVILSNLTNNWYYAIGDSATDISSPLSAWTIASTTQRVVADASPPAGSAKTYYLWRSENSNGSSPTYTGDSYSRTLVNYNRFDSNEDTYTLSSSNTFDVIISNTIANHQYYIYSGTSIVGGPIYGNGGALTISVTETGIPTSGDQVTHTLKSRGPQNSNTAEAYSTGVTYTVNRTGTGTTPGEPVEGNYGLEIYAAGSETNKLYDTQSLTGRIMASGRLPATSGTIAAGGNLDQTVTGMANTDDYVVIVVPQTSGSGNSGTEGAVDGHKFAVTKSTNKFNVTNNGAAANYYHYHVIKNGGS